MAKRISVLIVQRLHSLTGRVETVQRRLAQQKHLSDNHRRAYEGVEEAKRSLMRAIDAAEATR